MVKVCATVERVIGFGVSEAITGARHHLQAMLLDASPLGLTTCTVQARGVVPRLISASICVLLDEGDLPAAQSCGEARIADHYLETRAGKKPDR